MTETTTPGGGADGEPYGAEAQPDPVAPDDPRAADFDRKMAALRAVEIDTPEGVAFVEALRRRGTGETLSRPKEGSLFVLHGRNGAETTTILKRGARILGPSAKPQPLVRPRKVVMVDAPAKTTPETIGAAIVAAFDPFHLRVTRSPRRDDKDVWDRVKSLADEFQTRWLLVDRAHNIVRRHGRNEQQEIADRLLSLIVDPDLALNVVLCGNAEVMDFILGSTDLLAVQTNYLIGPIPPGDLAELKRFVGAFEAKLEFANRSDLTNDELLGMIDAATGGLRSAIKQLLIEAAQIAYFDDAVGLVLEHLAKAYDRMATSALPINPFRQSAGKRTPAASTDATKSR